MALRLLLVSPNPSLSRTLVEALNAAGEFDAHGVQTEARFRELTNCYDVALLDLAFGPQIIAWGDQLRSRCPEIRLAVIKADDGRPLPPDLHGWRLLHQPLTLDDLTAFLRRWQPTGDSLLDDRERVASVLQDAIQKTTAQLALLLRGRTLWAYTRGMPEHAVAEAAEEITRISHTGSSNLLRFIHLKSHKSQHMLYAMLLDGNTTLGILFNPDASFSEIRLQAERIVERFREKLTLPPAPAVDDTPAAEAPPAPPTLDENWLESGADPLDDWDPKGEEIPSIRDILKDVPAPTPSPMEGDPLLMAMQEKPPSIESSPPQKLTFPPASLEQTRVSRLGLLDATRLSPISELEETRRTNLGLTRPSSLQEEDLLQPAGSAAPADEKSNSITQAVGHLVLEPASPAFYNLHYACLLLTRRKEHRLDGDLKNFLKRWMRDIAVAYGWRIELLHIYPEFMQWVISIPPATSPNEMMRIVRMETSRRVLETFPRIRAELADDFWAPGYLLMGGDSLHPPVAVERYINQIRKSQDF